MKEVDSTIIDLHALYSLLSSSEDMLRLSSSSLAGADIHIRIHTRIRVRICIRMGALKYDITR